MLILFISLLVMGFVFAYKVIAEGRVMQRHKFLGEAAEAPEITNTAELIEQAAWLLEMYPSPSGDEERVDFYLFNRPGGQNLTKSRSLYYF